MAELLWECLILSIIVLFGINIGLAMGLTNLTKKRVLAISIFYGLVILIISAIAYFGNSIFYTAYNAFIPEILGFIGIISILGGIFTINEWKNKKDHDSVLSTATLSSSICCFTGFISVAVMLSKGMEISFLEIDVLITLAMILLITLFYSFSKILRHAETPYSVLLGNFMILNGFYFLASGAFIPNISNLSSLQMSPLSISSSSSLIFMVMAGLGVFLLGVYLKTEGITNLRDIYHRKSSSELNKTKKT